jgi:hypothetical protein
VEEYLVVGIKSGTPRVSKDKLVGSLRVIEAKDPVEAAKVYKSDIPTAKMRFLVIPMSDSRIVTLTPEVRAGSEEYQSYEAL